LSAGRRAHTDADTIGEGRRPVAAAATAATADIPVSRCVRARALVLV